MSISTLNPILKTFFKSFDVLIPIVDSSKDKGGKYAKKEELGISGGNVEFHRIDFNKVSAGMKLLRKWIGFLPSFVTFFSCIDASFPVVDSSENKGGKYSEAKELDISGGNIEFHKTIIKNEGITR